MSDLRSEAMIDEQLDLITQYLNSQLDATRAAEVRARLENDREFLQLAAPLLLAWDAMRNGRPARAGEAERRWDEFTRKADFEHHRKRRILRRNWLLGILLAAIMLPAFWFRADIRAQYRDWRDYAAVAPDTGWIRLRDHIRVRLDAGARMRSAKALGDVQNVKLDAGAARFRVDLTDTTRLMPASIPVVIRTRGGEVFSGYGDFTVTVRGDTTFVEEHEPERQRYLGFMLFPSMTLVSTNPKVDPVRVQTGDRMRLVRGSPPERLP